MKLFVIFFITMDYHTRFRAFEKRFAVGLVEILGGGGVRSDASGSSHRYAELRKGRCTLVKLLAS